MCKCIYCNSSDNLTVSDIIPFALTGAKVTKKFVCKTHNAFTNDNFEKDIIKNMNFFRNSLGLYERSGGEIKYKADLTISGHKITNIDISDRISIYEDKKRLFQVEKDGQKSLIGNIDVLRKKKGVEEKDIKVLDMKDAVVSVTFSFEEIFASEKMLLTIAKIAYEWHCYINNIFEFDNQKYQDIVDCIMLKKDVSDYVQIIIDRNLYNMVLENIATFGTHTLFEYIDENGNLYVVVGFWNIVAYKVKISSGNTPNTTNANSYKAYTYSIDDTKGETCFASIGGNDFISMPAKECIKRYHKVFASRTEKLLKTLVLTHSKVSSLTEILEKALRRYETSNSFAQLVDYEDNNRVTIIRLLEFLFQNQEIYDYRKSFNENMRTLYKEETVTFDVADNQAYLEYLLSLHEDKTLYENIEKWINFFKQLRE